MKVHVWKVHVAISAPCLNHSFIEYACEHVLRFFCGLSYDDNVP
jgi:hypothetical protein